MQHYYWNIYATKNLKVTVNMNLPAESKNFVIFIQIIAIFTHSFKSGKNAGIVYAPTLQICIASFARVWHSCVGTAWRIKITQKFSVTVADQIVSSSSKHSNSTSPQILWCKSKSKWKRCSHDWIWWLGQKLNGKKIKDGKKRLVYPGNLGSSNNLYLKKIIIYREKNRILATLNQY